jgi:hypothetical protein
MQFALEAIAAIRAARCPGGWRSAAASAEELLPGA